MITIGITCYNNSYFLKKAWESVLKQTNSSWRAVMVLDGGADKQTKKIFQQIVHPKLKKYVFEENQGPYGTRAKAIDISDTEWYYQLDGDDLLPSNAINDVIKAIEKNPKAEFIYGDCEVFSNDSTNLIKPLSDEEHLCYKTLFNAASPISKVLYSKIGGYNKSMYINADWDFWLSVYEQHIIGEYTDCIIYKYRIRKSNVGNKYMHLRPDIVDQIIKRHPVYFNNDQRENAARFYVLERLARYYRSIGDRFNAAKNVRLALQYGDSIPVFKSILSEEKMSTFRYFIRKIVRLITLYV